MKFITVLAFITLSVFATQCNADCSSEAKLYETICPKVEADKVYNHLWRPYDFDTDIFDFPYKPGAPDKLKEWEDKKTKMEQDFPNIANEAFTYAVDRVHKFFLSLSADAELHKNIVSNKTSFEFERNMAVYTAANPGYLMLGPAEVSVALGGYDAYLKFAILHEMGHVLDVIESVGTPLGKETRKKHLGAARQAIGYKFPGQAEEVWADFMGASMLGHDGTLNKNELLKAILPFCRGESGPKYPSIKTRTLLIARHPSIYHRLCKKPDGKVDEGARGDFNKHWFAYKCSDLSKTDCDKLKAGTQTLCNWVESKGQCENVPEFTNYNSKSAAYRPSHGGYPGFREILRSNK